MSDHVLKLTEEEVAAQCNKKGYFRNELYRLDRHGCQIQILKHIIDLLQQQIDELQQQIYELKNGNQ